LDQPWLARDHPEPNLSIMSEDGADLILDHLRAIRSEKERLGFLEAQYASISRRVDRIDGRLERIERRLDLVEA
jgi:hypothetical protein